jgi:hypothetical protein
MALGAGEQTDHALQFPLEVPRSEEGATIHGGTFFYGFVEYRGVFGGSALGHGASRPTPKLPASPLQAAPNTIIENTNPTAKARTAPACLSQRRGLEKSRAFGGATSILPR